MTLESAIYTGIVRHRRFSPTRHEFTFSTYMMYLDLGEIDRVFRGRLLWSVESPNVSWWRRADYLGDPERPLDDAVRERVAAEIGRAPSGPIRMLTHLRTWGTCFNPVTMYYCFDDAGQRVEAIVAEITNTPWNERHAYVLDARGAGSSGGSTRFKFDKEFHVSPFMPMRQRLDWRFGTPGARLGVHMRNEEPGGRVFDATLALHRKEISRASLSAALVRYPWNTARVVARIHAEALRLWIKRTPVHPHPSRAAASGSGQP